MQSISEPAVLAQTFCASGDKNTIPSSATGSQLASLEEGFPEITQKPIEDGGIPPEREDFNGALNLMSQFYYAFQNGWLPTFKTDVSAAIGGYPEGAVLWYMPTTGTYANKIVPLKSLTANNTYNFNTNPEYIGVYWAVVASTGGAGKSVGEVFWSQSSSAADNPGALPLFTGETIANADSVYPDFYVWVANHADLQISAADYSTAITTYGECPKYVIDTVNKTIRLPLLKNYIKNANITDGITQAEAGLPNITGTWDAYKVGNAGGGSATGALKISGGTQRGSAASESSQNTKLELDASESNGIYGNSATVTPSHTTLFPWVCAYNAAVEASVAQAAEFQNALTGKLDTDLGNLPNVGKDAIVNMCMPDYENGVTVVDVTPGTYTQVAKDSFVIVFASDPYTADAYLYISPDNGTTRYAVGRWYNDINSNVKGSSWSFFVPKGWYFTSNLEYAYDAYIYPLKGAQ